MACDSGKGVRYKCHNSSGTYGKMLVAALTGDHGQFVCLRHFDKKCSNDAESYQACGEELCIMTTKSLKNAICQLKVYNSEYGRVKVDLIEEKNKSGEPVTLPSGIFIDKNLICNDICDRRDCEDEANCNGYTYGQYFHKNESVSEPLMFIEPTSICTNYHAIICCKSYPPWPLLTVLNHWSMYAMPQPCVILKISKMPRFVHQRNLCTGLCTGLYWSVLVCTGLYWSVLVCTGLLHCFMRIFSITSHGASQDHNAMTILTKLIVPTQVGWV